jgi:hypothetical protein
MVILEQIIKIHTLVYLSSTTPGGSYNTGDATMQFIGSANTGTGLLVVKRHSNGIYRYRNRVQKNKLGKRNSYSVTVYNWRGLIILYNSTTAITSVTFLVMVVQQLLMQEQFTYMESNNE